MEQVPLILSCLKCFESSEPTEDILCMECDVTPGEDPKFYLDQVHGGRELHLGARQTWQKLNKHFPGHKIPFKVVDDYVKACPRCQKDRLQMTADIKPEVRTLIPDGYRTVLGIDALKVTPADKRGNTACYVIVNLKTKHVDIYPTPAQTEEAAALAIFTYICTYGMADAIRSDPGSDFTSNGLKLLNEWLGLGHQLSLVDVHESNGVERTNGEIMRHLRTLVNDFRIRNDWSSPWLVGLIRFMLNNRRHSESPYSAFELMFGSRDAEFFRLPDKESGEWHLDWLTSLNENLKVLRELTDKFQKELIAERKIENVPAESRNEYQPGDLVLYDTLYDNKARRSAKLDSRYKGPYEVLRHEKDEVECRHLALGSIKKLLVERLKLFVGSKDDAFKLAMEDADQFLINRITAWKGNPAVRTEMEFEVLFSDNDIVWKRWDQDLAETVQFEEYCRENLELHLLLFPVRRTAAESKVLRDQQITLVQPGDIVYVDIRSFQYDLYDDLNLDDKYHLRYVVRLEYTRWAGRQQRSIDGFVNVFQTTYNFDNLMVFQVGFRKEWEPNMVEITQGFLSIHRDLLQLIPDKRNRNKVEAELSR